jgi:hypothetical protein
MGLIVISRRPVMLAGYFGFIGAGSAYGQVTPAHIKKFEAWVAHINKNQETAPMTNGSLLGFPTEQVRRKQSGIKRDGVNRLFAVVIPAQRDGVVLAAGNSETSTFTVHRTGIHLRRISSARNVSRNVSRWSGPECDRDFKEQVDFWLALPLG